MLPTLAVLTLTTCGPTKAPTVDVAEVNSQNLGFTCACVGGKVVVSYGVAAPGAADEVDGLDCDPDQNAPAGGGNGNGNKTESLRPGRRNTKALQHPYTTAATSTDDPQPNIFSEALEPANAASTSYQLQEEYPNLLPLPFGPLFKTADLANDTPACTPGVSFYMANYTSSVVTRIATCPLAVMKRISMPSNPIQVKLTPDGSTAVVTIFNNAVVFINTATDTATTLSTPNYNPFGVAISPDGTKAYLTSYNQNTPVVFQINLATRQLLPQSLQLNTYPKSIFLTPDGAQAWVNFYNSSTLYVIDTLSMTVIGTLNAGGTADTGIAFSPDGTRAYVSVYGGSIAVFNTSTLAPVASIPVGDQPTDIYVSKDGSRALVNSYASSGSTSIIDTSLNSVIGTLAQKGPAMGLIIFH